MQVKYVVRKPKPDYDYESEHCGWFKNVLPTKYYKRKCRHCGYEMNFYVHKKKLCRVCNNYIYPDDREEFIERLKEKRKENDK